MSSRDGASHSPGKNPASCAEVLAERLFGESLGGGRRRIGHECPRAARADPGQLDGELRSGGWGGCSDGGRRQGQEEGRPNVSAAWGGHDRRGLVPTRTRGGARRVS